MQQQSGEVKILWSGQRSISFHHWRISIIPPLYFVHPVLQGSLKRAAKIQSKVSTRQIYDQGMFFMFSDNWYRFGMSNLPQSFLQPPQIHPLLGPPPHHPNLAPLLQGPHVWVPTITPFGPILVLQVVKTLVVVWFQLYSLSCTPWLLHLNYPQRDVQHHQ